MITDFTGACFELIKSVFIVSLISSNRNVSATIKTAVEINLLQGNLCAITDIVFHRHRRDMSFVNNNNNNTIWGGSVLTGEEPSPHFPELNHAHSQVGGPTQCQLSRPMSSGHHVSVEHGLRRKQLNSDTNASNKTYLKGKKATKEKKKLVFLRKSEKLSPPLPPPSPRDCSKNDFCQKKCYKKSWSNGGQKNSASRATQKREGKRKEKRRKMKKKGRKIRKEEKRKKKEAKKEKWRKWKR